MLEGGELVDTLVVGLAARSGRLMEELCPLRVVEDRFLDDPKKARDDMADCMTRLDQVCGRAS